MELNKLKNILESLLLASDKPMDMRRIEALFETDQDRPTRDEISKALQSLQEDYQGRGIHLKEVASGYRMQVSEHNAVWVARLWEEKPPKYSRALLETLVLIAYRQPITRGEIEEIRGVSVSSHIIKTLLEREWVRVLGHKDVPGKPAMYGTTREFLDYFNLKSLDELPALSEIKDLDKLHPELALDDDGEPTRPTAEGDADETSAEATDAVAETDETAEDAAEQALEENREEEEQGVETSAGHQSDATDETVEEGPENRAELDDESAKSRTDGASEQVSDDEPEAQAG